MVCGGILLYLVVTLLLFALADLWLPAISPVGLAAMTAAGGLMIMGIGAGVLLELRPIRVANYLPALVIAPAIAAILHALADYTVTRKK